MNYWINAFTSIYNAPWFGSGWGTFPGLFIQKVSLQEEITHYAHNHILEIISETGLIFGIGIVILYLFALILPSPADSEADFAEPKASPKLLYLIPLLLSALSLFYPPFAFITPEYSTLFSIFFWIIAPFIAYFAYSNLFIDPLKNTKILSLSALLLFVHSLVDFNLETMGIKILFFGLLGIQLSRQEIAMPQNFSFLMKIPQALVIILGVCTALSFCAHSNQKQQDLFLMQLRTTLSLHQQITPEELNTINSFIQKQKSNYTPAWEFSKLCYQYPSDPILSPLGINLIEQAILKAPANQRLHLLKARFLERMNRKKDALSLYLKLLKNNSLYKKWNYIFILNDNEMKFISTRIQELKNFLNANT